MQTLKYHLSKITYFFKFRIAFPLITLPSIFLSCRLIHCKIKILYWKCVFDTSCAYVILRFLLITNLCNIVCLWSRPIAHRFEYFFNRIWVALACLCYCFSHDCMTYFSFPKNLEKYEWRSKDFGTYSDFCLFAKRDVITWQPPQPYNFVKVAVSILRFTQKWRNLFASCRRFIFSPVLLT